MERVLGELDETLLEPFKEEHEEGMIINVALGKQIATLNDFLKGASFGVGTISFITKILMCANFVNLHIILPQCVCT